MIGIYGLRYETVVIITVVMIALWYDGQEKMPAKAWKTANALGVLCELGLIWYFTVAGRERTDQHTFVFFAERSNEFYREMLMNAFLYVPLGLCLTVFTRGWSILLALCLSLGIESWQYFGGLGVAQGTDVIMNTIGCTVGAVPFFLRHILQKNACKR